MSAAAKQNGIKPKQGILHSTELQRNTENDSIKRSQKIQ
jgi:hypothetical protein